MKQLIAPIAIIAALIVFFVVVDRKEFNHHDNVHAVRSESPTANRKLLVSVPETMHETEAMIAVETKSVEEKSVDTVQKKKIRSLLKPSRHAGTEPEEKPVPVAVPVVTAEEAKLLNVDTSSDSYLVLTYCCETNDHFELDVNGTSYPLTGADHSYLWLKKVMSIPRGTNKLSIKAKGKGNAYIAIGDIKLYQ